MIARILSFFVTCCLLLVTSAVPAFAQSATPSASSLPTTNYQLPTIPAGSPQFTDLILQNMFHSASCLMIGQSVIKQPCLSYQNGIPVLSQVDTSGGLLGATGSLIGLLYKNPPVRTADYLASVGQDLGIVKEANAQVIGSGANVLSPILSLWQVSRNMSYVIMIIIFVIIGLMVMFRQRINPQTVITAQSALPGLVIGLIMITFSYFLAGLISDMAFVGTNVVGYYFAAAQGPTALADTDRTNLVQHISTKSVLNIFGPLTGFVGRDDISAALDNIMTQLPAGTQFTLRTIVGFLVAQFFAPLAGGISGIGAAVGTSAGPWGLILGPGASLATTLAAGITGFAAPTFGLGFALSFVATLALIYAMIKLLLRLVSAFLTIIFYTVSAPFQFMVASLPGRQGIGTNWMLNMLANILIFPAVLAVFYFVAFLLGPKVVGQDYPLKVSALNHIENNNLILNVNAQEQLNIVDSYTYPLFGGLNLNFIKILLAFGSLMAIPKIPDLVVNTIGKMGQTGQLLGQEISGGIRSGQGYANQFQGAVSSTSGGLKESAFGRSDVHWTDTGPKYGLVKPGVAQLINRNDSWNPLKWKIRQTSNIK